MKLPKLQNADIKGKTVLVRADTDVDIVDNHIIDSTRLESAMATIEYVVAHRAKVILIGHLGRPDPNKSRNEQQKFSMLPIARWFARKFQDGELKEQLFGSFPGWSITPSFSVLDNIRFFKGEEENDQEFSKQLAELGDVYVNEVFGVSHRKHASIVGVPSILPHFAGFHLQKEIDVLSKVIKKPDRPLVVIIGGAKIETKLPLVEKMHKVADYVLVGGEIAEQTQVLLKVQHEKIKGRKSVLLIGEVNEQKNDLSQTSVENFLQVLPLAKTIVWNGPVGLIRSKEERENDKKHLDTEHGTRILAEGIVHLSAYSIIGGGDTLAYLRELHLLDKFSFVSTGGGAMLSFLSGEELPGIKVLTQ